MIQNRNLFVFVSLLNVKNSIYAKVIYLGKCIRWNTGGDGMGQSGWKNPAPELSAPLKRTSKKK